MAFTKLVLAKGLFEPYRLIPILTTVCLQKRLPKYKMASFTLQT